MNANEKPIDITVQFPNNFGGDIDIGAWESNIQDVVRNLHIPGTVQLQQGESLSHNALRKLAVSIDGQPCLYPESLWNQATALAKGEIGYSDVDQGMETLLDDELIELYRLVFVEAVKHNADMLFTGANAKAYYEDVAVSLHPADAQLFDVVHEALKEILRRWIAIGPSSDVIDVLNALLKKYGQVSRIELFETLMARWRPRELAIYVSPQYLQAIVEVASGDDRNIFNQWRLWLFKELGTYFPSFVIELDELDELPEGQFSFRINHLRTMPQWGLSPGEYLLNVVPSWLDGTSIDSRLAYNPVHQRTQSIISSSDHAAATDRGYYIWSPFNYLAFALSGHLRDACGSLFDRSVTNGLLSSLQSSAPAAVEACDALDSRNELTTILRLLLDERVSIRDLARVLQVILDQTSITLKKGADSQFDWRWKNYDQADMSDPHTIASYVRLAIKDSIQEQYAGVSTELSVMTLAPQFERSLEGQTPSSSTKIQEQLLVALESYYLFKTALEYPIVTSSIENRLLVRRLIQKAYPDIPVLAEAEVFPLSMFRAHRIDPVVM